MLPPTVLLHADLQSFAIRSRNKSDSGAPDRLTIGKAADTIKSELIWVGR